MNRRMVLSMVGKVVLIEAALMLPALITSIIYKESCVTAIAVSIAICLAAGALLTVIFKPSSDVIFAKEGFVIVALCWIVLSALGALPFYISREIPSYIDAFFETASGFSTTGASILTDVEAMSRGLLFWRSFTHWVGGMGVLVFVMAVVNSLSDRSIHILRAESPGPVVGKIVPKMKETTRILYIIYIALTVLNVIFLLIGGMPFFESLLHAFGTAGTGGFGVKGDSFASYSPYIQWVTTIFMLVFGINFNIYYLLLIRKWKRAFKSGELWFYAGMVLVSVVAIFINVFPIYGSFSEAVRQSAFQVATIVSTTGYATADFNLWPSFSKTILFLLMFVGACAGSTAGGFKCSRVIILFKKIQCETKKLLHPRSVNSVRFEGKPVENKLISSVSSYLTVYIFIYCIITLLISLDGFDIETNISAATACFNNIGPGLSAVGPTANYAAFSPFSKVVLSVAMLFGRLEIYPMLITLSPSIWMKK